MKYDWLDSYLLSKPYSVKDYKEEWGWDRYLIGGKMFGAICGSGEKTILTLKCEPLFGGLLREKYKDITPGYYMNKTHWNSVDLAGDTPDDILKEMIDMSYSLVFNSLTKKQQKEFL